MYNSNGSVNKQSLHHNSASYPQLGHGCPILLGINIDFTPTEMDFEENNDSKQCQYISLCNSYNIISATIEPWKSLWTVKRSVWFSIRSRGATHGTCKEIKMSYVHFIYVYRVSLCVVMQRTACYYCYNSVNKKVVLAAMFPHVFIWKTSPPSSHSSFFLPLN